MKFRNWPGGIHRCSKCGKEYKQRASLAAHLLHPCMPAKPKRHRYPKHYRDYLVSTGAKPDGSIAVPPLRGFPREDAR